MTPQGDGMDFDKEGRLTVDKLWQERFTPDPYTQEQFDTAAKVIATALRAAYARAVEDCAKIADLQPQFINEGEAWGAWTAEEAEFMRGTAGKIAQAIRALSGGRPEGDTR